MPNDFDTQGLDETMNRVQYWAHHMRGWTSRDNTCFVRYEDLIHNYARTLRHIAKQVGLPTHRMIRDLRIASEASPPSTWHKFRKKIALSLLPRDRVPVEFSTVSFRKGESGEWKNYFSKDDLAFFNDYAQSLLLEQWS